MSLLCAALEPGARNLKLLSQRFCFFRQLRVRYLLRLAQNLLRGFEKWCQVLRGYHASSFNTRNLNVSTFDSYLQNGRPFLVFFCVRFGKVWFQLHNSPTISFHVYNLIILCQIVLKMFSQPRTKFFVRACTDSEPSIFPEMCRSWESDTSVYRWIWASCPTSFEVKLNSPLKTYDNIGTVWNHECASEW